MRIVAGSARGRKLITPEGIDIRPTTDKVKEAMFSIIQFDLQNKSILDLFAGTGQLGLEAISRGAKSVCFVDSSKKALELVKKNISLTGFSDSVRVFHGDSFSFLKNSKEKFDIIILDPPYENGMCDKAAGLLPDVLNKNAIIICETRPDELLPENIGELKIAKEYKYSAIKLTVYREVEE